MDRFDLYELCVQSPVHACAMLRAIHGANPRAPRILAEDFCGTAAVSREWVKDADCSAVGLDADGPTIEHAKRFLAPRLTLVQADALSDTRPGHTADVVFVGNFSIGEIHDRATLVRYLHASYTRIAPGGVFVCDTYGGESAFRIGAVARSHAAADGTIVHYTWEQRFADPATGMVENALHFRVQERGEIVAEMPEAFVYRWRLWSIPELRDAMIDAGFDATEVHLSLSGAASDEPLPPSYIVCVAGRREQSTPIV